MANTIALSTLSATGFKEFLTVLRGVLAQAATAFLTRCTTAQAITHAARQDTVVSIKAHHAATVAAASSRAKSPLSCVSDAACRLLLLAHHLMLYWCSSAQQAKDAEG